uniref:JmjC domain-containing protein n=1 Tax=Panagrolaimus superbus TaxID=310955 RepID=A0A914XYA7_9BILA
MGIRSPEFWTNLPHMHEEGFPEIFDYLRFEKGGENVPFLCLHPDPDFLEMLSLDEIVWPENFDFCTTSSSIKNEMPGVYKLLKKQMCPAKPLDENGEQIPQMSAIDALKEHLGKMKQQSINVETDEATFRQLLSRKHLEDQTHFAYNEDLAFSVLNLLASSNSDFPQKWNFDNVPGPLKALCSGDGGINEILGVSTAMVYAGTAGTYSSYHVEDADCPSANILLPGSAGKAWFGIHPDDQWKLNDYVRQQFRKKCPSPFLHKDLMIDLELLDELGIRWYWCIQRPGDIILTNPSVNYFVK